jgi:hypothetical protein
LSLLACSNLFIKICKGNNEHWGLYYENTTSCQLVKTWRLD